MGVRACMCVCVLLVLFNTASPADNHGSLGQPAFRNLHSLSTVLKA